MGYIRSGDIDAKIYSILELVVNNKGRQEFFREICGRDSWPRRVRGMTFENFGEPLKRFGVKFIDYDN